MWLEPISRVDVAGEMRLDVVVWLDDSGLPMFWNGMVTSPLRVSKHLDQPSGIYRSTT
jgi:hypothetical protein